MEENSDIIQNISNTVTLSQLVRNTWNDSNACAVAGVWIFETNNKKALPTIRNSLYMCNY